jgi:hypothetical protein
MNARTMAAAVTCAGIIVAATAACTTNTASGPGPLVIPEPATAPVGTFERDGAAFAAYIRGTSDSVDYASDLEIWQTGVKLCAAFDEGVTMQGYFDGMVGVPSDIVAVFPFGAVNYVCPRNKPIVDAYVAQ